MKNKMKRKTKKIIEFKKQKLKKLKVLKKISVRSVQLHTTFCKNKERILKSKT